MTPPLVMALLTGLGWWILVVTIYSGMLFGLDRLLSEAQRRQRQRAELQRNLLQLNKKADEAIRRIGAAYAVTQQLIRQEGTCAETSRRAQTLGAER